MEISEIRGTKAHHLSGFYFPKVVETIVCFKAFRDGLRDSLYGWSDADAVELQYFNNNEQRFLPLTCDEHLGLLFTLNAESRFGKILIDVIQPHKARDSGKGGKGASSATANSQQPGTPCRLRPSKASGSESHNMSAADSAASPVPAAAVYEEAEPDEEVPANDDEDETMYPELGDIASQQAVDDEYPEMPISRARFDDTDNEEKEENMDSLIEDEYDGEDMPTIEWNREAPELT